MTRPLRVLLALAAAWLPRAVSAAPLSVEEVVESTIRNHPVVAAAVQERALAEADLLSAEGAFDRTLNGYLSNYFLGGYSGSYYDVYLDQPFASFGGRVFAGYRRGGGTFPIYDNYFETNQEGEGRIGAEVSLLRDRVTDKRRTALSKARVQQDVATANIDLRRIDLVRVGSMLYWDWVAAGRKYNIYKALLAVAGKRQTQIEERIRSGDLPQFDETDNRRALLQRESQLLAAERSLRKSEFELSLFLRDETGAPLMPSMSRLPPEMPRPRIRQNPDPDATVTLALGRRPELARLAKQIEQNALEQRLAANQILPKADLAVAAAKDEGPGNSSRAEGELKGGLKIEIPLQTRTQQGRIDFYRSKEIELKSLKAFAEQKVETEVRDAINALGLSLRRAEVARDEWSAARELERGENIRFREGDSNLIFVNLREQTTADAAVRFVDALLDYHKSWVAYEAAIASNLKEMAEGVKADK